MMTLIEFKNKAMDVFRVDKKEIVHQDPISFLYSLDWYVPNGPQFSSEILTQMNINFDEQGCFGRAVKGAVLCEQFFPNNVMYSGEVCNDLLRTMLLEKAGFTQWNDETFIVELLQYEDPHVVLLDDKGNQFDSIFKVLSIAPKNLKHPNVLQHELWKLLHCSYLLSEALINRNTNFDAYFISLHHIYKLYPEILLVKENLASAYCMVGDDDKAIEIIKSVALIRKDAKILFFLWLLTDDVVYKNQIIKEYSLEMFVYLRKIFSV